jgi:hypothetical protein
MARFRENLANLLEYAGIRSKNYYHAPAAPTYDPDDPLSYYLEQSHRADYHGPFDDDGVPLYVSRGITGYLPVLLCAYALGHLARYRKSRSEENLAAFDNIVHWLVKEQNAKGVWLTRFPAKKYGLFDPFPCAMVQGLAISCLVRAFLITRQKEYIDFAVRALEPYRVDVSVGGVASYTGGRVFFEEFPADPCHHVLNGFIFAIWGLHDLARVVQHGQAGELFDEGLATLVEWLPRYDMGYWSLYHIGSGPRNPATVPYHRLHISQLQVMHRVTGQAVFAEYQQRWTDYLNGHLNALRALPVKTRWLLSRPPAGRRRERGD